MESTSYIRGVLDALVKSGEMSSDYANGVMSVLEKDAAWYTPWTWFDDTPHKNYQDEMDAFLKKNPDRYTPGGNLRITADEATRLIDDSRHWHDNFWNRAGTWAGNRARKLWAKTGLGHSSMRPEQYDRELIDKNNQYRHEYIQRALSRPGYSIDPAVLAAVQDAHVRDAGRRLADAKETMSDTARAAAGLTDSYANRYRTPAGTAAMTGGLYQPKYDVPKPKAEKSYGDDIPDTYGPKKSLTYHRPVFT